MEKMPESTEGKEEGEWGILTEAEGPKRNVRAEWEALQKQAKAENFGAKNFERKEKDLERERKRQIGARLMRAVELLSEAADDEKLEGRVERIYRMAELAGRREELEKDVKRHMKNDFEAPGRKSYGAEKETAIKTGLSEEEKAGLSEEERVRLGIAEMAEKLTENAVELKGADLSGEFPSGNYLFHSADVKHVGQILKSGKLMNAIAVAEQTGVGAFASANSGGEGISWSMNGIDALPGTRGHLAGFLAAPEAVLGGGAEGDSNGETKMVIPSRPAPYEVLQVSSGLNGKEFFETKKQVEVWGDRGVSFSDKASVDANLIFLGMQNEFSTSLLQKFADNGGLPAEELRKHYTLEKATNTVEKNGREKVIDAAGGMENEVEKKRIKLDEQLYQQKFDENFIPPAAVYIQSLIDRGKINPEGGVNGMIDLIKNDKELRMMMVHEARGESNEVVKKYEKEWEAAKGIEVPLSEMYFVCSHADLPAWAKMMAESGTRPKGILLYDDEQVVLPNFASAHKGNHDELTREVNGAVKVNGDFWRDEFGMDVENMERAGSQGQVLREADVSHDKEIKMVDGELTVGEATGE